MPGIRKFTLLERIEQKILPEPNSGCFLWTGALYTNGYALIGLWQDGKTTAFLAHRVYYELINGAIPPDLELDHKCRVKSCINPNHLEPVTHKENMRRAPKNNRPNCPNGHPYSGPNLWIYRGLRRCR